MKAIPEKNLLEMVSNLIKSSRLEEAEIIQRLIDEELEEIDTLTVSRLRHMCDAPKDGSSIFCVLNGSENFQEMYYLQGLWWLSGVESYFNDDHITGWVHKPIYKPEKE